MTKLSGIPSFSGLLEKRQGVREGGTEGQEAEDHVVEAQAGENCKKN